MTNKIILTEEDTLTLLSFLGGEPATTESKVTFLDPLDQQQTIPTSTFSDFRAEGDLELNLFSCGSLLGFALTLVSGQSSKFGVYDFLTKSWILKEDFPAQEILAVGFAPDSKNVYLASWIYRFNHPPVCLLEKRGLFCDLQPVELVLIATEELFQPIDVPRIDFAIDKHEILFRWGRNLYRFQDKGNDANC
jgi:hypothetical protein